MTALGAAELLLTAVRHEATGVLSFEFVAPQGCELSAFTAGATVNVCLGQSLVHVYSLANGQAARHRYLLALPLDQAGRDGSRQKNGKLRVWRGVMVDVPRSPFALGESTKRSVLLAGGIGITSIWSMARRLEVLGRSWRLYYCTRSRAHTALVDVIEAWARTNTVGELVLDLGGERSPLSPDLARIVVEVGMSAYLYCCGKQAVLDPSPQETSAVSCERVRVANFGAAVLSVGAADSLELVFARSGWRMEVRPGKSMLDAGESPQYGRMQGVCIMCEAAATKGEPNHRDVIFGHEVKASHRGRHFVLLGHRVARVGYRSLSCREQPPRPVQPWFGSMGRNHSKAKSRKQSS